MLFYKDIISFLYNIDKLKLLSVLSLTIISAICETITILLLFPVLMLLLSSNEDAVDKVFEYFPGFELLNDPYFIIYLLIFFLIFSYLLRLFYLIYSTKISFKYGREVNKNILYGIMNSFEVNYQNYTNLVNLLTRRNDSLIYEIIFPVFTLLYSIMQFIFIIVALFFVIDPIYILLSTSIGLIYFVISLLMKKGITIRSKEISSLSDGINERLTETTRALDQIRIFQASRVFISQILYLEKKYRNKQSFNQIMIHSPKLILELLGVILLLLASLLTSTSDTVPQLGVLAFAFFRLLPMFQAIFNASSNIRIGQASLSVVKKFLNTSKNNGKYIRNIRSIVFDKISLSFGENIICKDLDFIIKTNEITCISGASGAGKSSILGLITGLIVPNSGSIIINEIVSKVHSDFPVNVSVCPQEPLLLSGSIEENITLGKSVKNFSVDEALDLAGLSQANSFTKSSFVEFGGANFSGGQKQRIGLARAIYHLQDILILDEPTSALDEINADKIMTNLIKINKEKIIIIATHDSTIKAKCDKLMELKK